jgi:hypothetical protein
VLEYYLNIVDFFSGFLVVTSGYYGVKKRSRNMVGCFWILALIECIITFYAAELIFHGMFVRISFGRDAKCYYSGGDHFPNKMIKCFCCDSAAGHFNNAADDDGSMCTGMQVGEHWCDDQHLNYGTSMFIYVFFGTLYILVGIVSSSQNSIDFQHFHRFPKDASFIHTN